MFSRSIDLDPMFAGGYRALALAQLDGATQFHVRGFEQARTAAEALAVHAIALDRTDAEARSAFAATLLIGHGDHEGARIEAERALALTPHLASAHGVLGAVFTYAGQPREGLVSFATFKGLAAALVRLGRIPEAKETVAKAIAVAPGSFDMYFRQRVPWMRPRDHESLVDDLVKAGWQHDQGRESR
jgi:adenylate cyclase